MDWGLSFIIILDHGAKMLYPGATALDSGANMLDPGASAEAPIFYWLKRH